jgi:hypothetical protein
MYYMSVPPSTVQLVSCACQERLVNLRDVSKHANISDYRIAFTHGSSTSELVTPQLPMQVRHNKLQKF